MRRQTTVYRQRGGCDDIRRWLYRVATNNAFSMLRHHRLIHWEPLDDHTELLPDTRMSFEDHLAENDILRAALARLAPQDAACLLLRVVHGFNARAKPRGDAQDIA